MSPSEQLTVLWFECQGNFVAIRRLRRIAACGMEKLGTLSYQDGYRTPELLLEISNGDWNFPDETVFEHEFRDRVGNLSRDSAVSGGQNSIDAASLVFAHSILDYCANECCRISARVCVADWETAISDRKVTWEEFKDGNYSDVLGSRVSAYVEDISRRASVMTRIDLLNQKCQPAPPFNRHGEEYHYERASLEKIDARRHEIVHRMALAMPLEGVEGDLRYLEVTTEYLVYLMSYKYQLRIDLQFWTKHCQATRPASSGIGTEIRKPVGRKDSPTARVTAREDDFSS